MGFNEAIICLIDVVEMSNESLDAYCRVEPLFVTKVLKLHQFKLYMYFYNISALAHAIVLPTVRDLQQHIIMQSLTYMPLLALFQSVFRVQEGVMPQTQMSYQSFIPQKASGGGAESWLGDPNTKLTP
eukprot:15364837-Ditylum_brightwellii.AAC.1